MKYEQGIYYAGFSGVLGIRELDKKMVVYAKDEETEAETVAKVEKNDAKKALQTIFESLKKKSKIKSVFEQPKHFYEKMMEESLDISEGEVLYDKIYNLLRKKYNPIEIEEKCCTYYKEDMLEKRELVEEVFIFSFEEDIFYVDESVDKVLIFEANDESIEKIMNLILKDTRKVIKETIRSAKKRS